MSLNNRKHFQTQMKAFITVQACEAHQSDKKNHLDNKSSENNFYHKRICHNAKKKISLTFSYSFIELQLRSRQPN